MADINQMFAQGDLMVGVASVSGNSADLNGDSLINSTDIDVRLDSAARFNGYTTPYNRGDADDLGNIAQAQRNVDLTDFNALTTNFSPAGDGNPTNGTFWDQGDFDGDADITDFTFLKRNFSPTGYNAPPRVPEPRTNLMLLGVLLTGLRYTRRGRPCQPHK